MYTREDPPFNKTIACGCHTKKSAYTEFDALCEYDGNVIFSFFVQMKMSNYFGTSLCHIFDHLYSIFM